MPSVLLMPDEIEWTEAPPSLPPGAKIAVIEDDGLKNKEPQKNQGQPFTFRLLLPINYKIASHTHPTSEHVTVISGMFYFGEGNEFVIEDAKAYPPGSVIIMPPGKPMFGFTKDQEVIIQVHGVGPWNIKYSNPADDPRPLQP